MIRNGGNGFFVLPMVAYSSACIEFTLSSRGTVNFCGQNLAKYGERADGERGDGQRGDGERGKVWRGKLL